MRAVKRDGSFQKQTPNSGRVTKIEGDVITIIQHSCSKKWKVHKLMPLNIENFPQFDDPYKVKMNARLLYINCRNKILGKKTKEYSAKFLKRTK